MRANILDEVLHRLCRAARAHSRAACSETSGTSSTCAMISMSMHSSPALRPASAAAREHDEHEAKKVAHELRSYIAPTLQSSQSSRHIVHVGQFYTPETTPCADSHSHILGRSVDVNREAARKSIVNRCES